MLIAHGLSVSDRHADGFTPLHRACWGKTPAHTETVRLERARRWRRTLQPQADLRPPSPSPAQVQVLLEAGADPKVPCAQSPS